MVSESEERPRRKRGVRLSDLDRAKSWVIAHTGRRWEVVGPVEGQGDAGGGLAGGGPPGAGDGVASTGGNSGAPPWASLEFRQPGRALEQPEG